MSRVTTPPTARPATPAMPVAPTTSTPPMMAGVGVPREKIAMRAYEKWVKSGCRHGCDQQHWLEAETELKNELARQAKR